MNVLGIMSGSSLDGLDMALCSFEHTVSSDIKWNVLHTSAIDFPPKIKHDLSCCAQMSVRELKELEVRFSRFCARAINEIEHDTDMIASHGHTVIHHPEDGYSVQIGSGAIIAEETGIPCICDVRANDIALGGQGAPVAPIVERLLLQGYDFYINLGGIANLSIHTDSDVLSWDSVPCNQVLNHFANLLGHDFDNKGVLARSGRLHEGLLEAWLELPYFRKDYPKSLDNNWVRSDFIAVTQQFSLEPKDVLRTMVEVSAVQLYRDMVSLDFQGQHERRCLISGGGAHNDFLIERLSNLLEDSRIEIIKPDDQIIDYKEGILMALMGYLRANLLDNTISTVTGARSNSIGGCIYRPNRKL